MGKHRAGKIVGAKKNRSGVKQESPAHGLPNAAGIVLIFCLAVIVYFPSLRGSLLWEDAFHVTAPALQSLHGLWRIWTEPGVTQQYNPVLHTAFWIQHRLWGDAVLGYHLTNILLHSISAFLVVLIIRRLRLPGAWLAGLIFCLHPICAESVAWISGQKIALSAVFYLAAALTYLRFDESRKKSLYYLGIGFFVLALLSNSITATLPVALLIVLWWRHERIGRKKDLYPLLPWLGLGILVALFSGWVDKTYAGVLQGGEAFSFTLLERCLLAGRVVWFYLAKLAWPPDLTFIYPRFSIDASAGWHYAFPAGVLALLACFWLLRSKRRGPMAGLLFFIVTLFPVLGFFNAFAFRYSYVADHLQYFACLGILIPAACGLMIVTGTHSEFRLLKNNKPSPEAVACGILLLILGVLTWKQSGMYSDPETLWRATIARDPGSSLAHSNLGEILFRQEHADEAMEHCRKAVALAPGNAEANANLANVLRYKQQFNEAVVYYQKASELKPDIASFHGGIANTLIEIGKIKEAMPSYEEAMRLDPTNGMLANNLAWILATCPEASVRNGKRALEVASQAVRLIGDKDPTAVGTLAAALAELGRFDEAIATEKRAHALAQATGDAELTDWHALLLGTYQSRQPHRESSLEQK